MSCQGSTLMFIEVLAFSGKKNWTSSFFLKLNGTPKLVPEAKPMKMTAAQLGQSFPSRVLEVV